MSTSPVLAVGPLGTPPWRTFDPFLFCVHHVDHYPAGNDEMGPQASLAGRNLGQDFAGKDGWSMYHGRSIPGFPSHPHRGFETVTLARRGYIDHSDSLGARARFGHGDVQWLTAGKGIVHCEMFPLVERDAPNPTELFQIWLNLPADAKMVEPHFSMLWSSTIPRRTFTDAEGRETEVVVVAGEMGDATPPSPPPRSWASRANAEVAIWTIRMAPNARWTLPAGAEGLNRALYFFEGQSLRVADRKLPASSLAKVRSDAAVELVNGPAEAEVLMLQGRPIGEPVAHYGPFVMNTTAELQQAFEDYRNTGFGGWPFESSGPVHPRDKGRFAIHADGREETPG